MKTMKMLSRETEIKAYSLAVIDDDGFAVAVLAMNVSINEATEIETYFNFDKLSDTQHLARFTTSENGTHYVQELYDDDASNWMRVAG